MKRHHIVATVAMAFLAMLATSCEKPLSGFPITFNATIEKEIYDYNTKVHLVNEQWIYWEIGDLVSIGANSGGPSRARLTRTSYPDWEDFNAVFVTDDDLPAGAKYFLGIHPYSPNHVINGSSGNADFSAVIDLPDEQPFRNDSTFAKQVYPMVAWYGGEWTSEPYEPFNLTFRSLAGIVRLQIFNNTGSDEEVDYITIEDKSATGHQLVGKFDIKNYKNPQPYLAPKEPANKTLTLRCDEPRRFNGNDLLTFYVVLPALGSNEHTETYELTMTVHTVSGKTCERSFKANVRRTGITNLPALGIGSWGEGNSVSLGLAGVGTATRPFKVYSLADLKYLRDCYKSSTPRINNQPVTRDTYIRIMRSDIELDAANWTEGIRNFMGHLSNVSAQSNPGIVMTSDCTRPLFESVGPNGYVDGLTLRVRGVVQNLESSGDVVSPFCWTNNGHLTGCRLIADGDGSKVRSLYFIGGICANNAGTIDACRSGVDLEAHGTTRNVGIVCYSNSGVVKGCQLTSEFTVSADRVGGIVYTNSGTVRDCYFASSMTGSAADWGGIAYSNSGSVARCYVGNAIVTTGHVGGIVCEMTGGTIDSCRSEAALQGSGAGAIAYLVNGSNCLVVNCHNNSAFSQVRLQATAATDAAGGLVARLQRGTIENSFVDFLHVNRLGNVGITGGLVGVVGEAGKLKNCYAYEATAASHTLYGTSAAPAGNFDRCYLVEGSQANATTVSLADAKKGVGETDCLVDKLNATPAVTWSAWKVVSGSLPVLDF